jgi:hypothetical protein
MLSRLKCAGIYVTRLVDQNFQRWRVLYLGVIAGIAKAKPPRMATLPTNLTKYRKKSRIRASTPNLAISSPLVAHFIHTPRRKK